MKSSDREFISESEDILEEAESHLLDIQDSQPGEPKPDSINALFRCMHTLKGMSGLYGYQELSDISHALENLLDDVRLGRTTMSEEMITFLFEQLDLLKDFVRSLFKKKTFRLKDSSRVLANIEKFRRIVPEHGVEKVEEVPIDETLLKVLSEYEEHRLRTNIRNAKGIYLVRVTFSLMEFDRLLKELTEKIKNTGELISTMPTSEGVPDGSIGFSLLTASGMPLGKIKMMLDADIEELVRVKAEEPTLLTRRGGEAAAEEDVQQSGSRASGAGTPTVRVDISKLDISLNTIGELSVITSTLRSVWKELSETQGHNPTVIELYRLWQGYERRISKLKDQILQIRMVPVSQLYAKLGQVIRRSARSLGKKLHMEMFGEDTEIDKSLAEEILDPLIHIVRNAIDHGIELPQEREEHGKPSHGSIRLKSFQRGNNVVIEITDDGRGIDSEKIKVKAIDKGLVSAKESLTEEEVYELLFSPGFSTKENVSEISGRGVGLDVVKEKLASLGGLVEIKSRKGTGTTVVLTLPITLAIVKAMIVKVGKTKFALPLSSISETLVIEEGVLQEVERSWVLDLRGEVLPMKDLRDVFSLPGTSPARPFAVVAGMGEKKAGLIVDELLGQQEIVIKTMGDYFDGASGIAGAAEISRHEIILVLDVEAIVSGAHHQNKGASNV